MKASHGLLALIAVGLLTGCASQHRQLVYFPDQQKTLDNHEKGRIYVIRKPWSINWASHVALVQIRDNDQEIGSIAGHRGYLCWERDPGLATLTTISGFQEARIEQQVEQGKVYYILQGLRPASTCLGIPLGQTMVVSLQAVDEETGKKELKNCIPPSTEKKSDSDAKGKAASETGKD